MRSTAIVLAIVVVVGAASLSAQEITGLTAECGGSSITLSYAGFNFGTTPVVQIWRRDLTDCGPWTVRATGFAAPLQPVQIDAVDSDVVPGRLYHYTIGSDTPPTGISAAPVDFQGYWVFVDAFAGCDNPPVAEGSVVEIWDGAASYVWTVMCPGTCYPQMPLWTGRELVSDYLDGDPVTIYGSIQWTLHLSWAVFATSAEPGDCTTVGVEVAPWTRIKTLYR